MKASPEASDEEALMEDYGDFDDEELADELDTEAGEAELEAEREKEERRNLKMEKKKEFKFSTDIYMQLLVTLMYKQTTGPVRCCMLTWPALLVLITGASQIVTVVTVWAHVMDNELTKNWANVDLALWQLSQVDGTVNKGVYERICGEYENYEVGAPKAGARVQLPVDTDVSAIQSFEGIWFFAKLPLWRWNTKYLGGDRAIMDDARYIIDEGFVGIHQGYCWLFILITFMWFAQVLVEVRTCVRFAAMLFSVPTSGRVGESLELKSDPEDPDKVFALTHMSIPAKCLGWFLCTLQLSIAILIAIVGCALFLQTTSKIELVLNALALTFVLELDVVVYAGIVTQTQQMFLEDIKPVKYPSRIPAWYLKHHRVIFPPFAFALCVFLALELRQMQLSQFTSLFNASAGVCLLAGTPADENYYAPVAGMCESLLSLTCQDSERVKGDDGPFKVAVPGKGNCVITDFNVRWPKDITKPSTVSVWAGEAMTKSADSIWDWKWGSQTMGSNGLTWSQQKYDLLRYQYTTDSATVLRRACFAMYDPLAPVHEVTVDEETNEKNVVAPFKCHKEGSGMKSVKFNNLGYVGEGSKARLNFDFPLYEGDPGLGVLFAKCLSVPVTGTAATNSAR